MKKYILTFIVFFVLASLHAQEILSSLQYNPVIVKQFEARSGNMKKTVQLAENIQLPFFEDFTGQAGYPDIQLWSDDKIYVNQGFAVFPPNYGVATFDALDSSGKIYAHATYTPFEADHLTSNPIRLDSLFQPLPKPLRKSDSLYFSFYYQPQGMGNQPQPGDSLILEFFSPATGLWNQVWSSEGMPLDTFRLHNNTWFKQVILPISDSATYYAKDFKFRFTNFASIANQILPGWQSNMDQWNVDYIYLNTGRSAGDTVYRDISFVDVSRSFLKNYTVMPYYQYSNDPTNEMRDTCYNLISNLDTVAHPSKYEYIILDENGVQVDLYYAGNYSIMPFIESGYVDYQPFSKPKIKSILPIDPFGVKDSTIFTIRHIVTGDFTGNDRLFDTLDIKQEFSNYLAYDDGIPEAGYGLTPAGSQGAVKFTINSKDTLRGVKIYFNPTKSNANAKLFYLNVWEDNNGIPGGYLNDDTLVVADFDKSPHDFQTFVFRDPVVVRNSFFIGWEQTTNDNLNIGFDKSINNGSKIFYNTNGQWAQSMFDGSLMIRPILGKPIAPVKDKPKKMSAELVLSPNPLNGNELSILIPGALRGYTPGELHVQVYNHTGQLVLDIPYEARLQLSGLSTGIYILRVFAIDGSTSASSKLIISR